MDFIPAATAGSGSGASIGTATPIVDGTATAGVSTTASADDHVHPTDTSRAALASPTFSGTPSLPTGTTATTQSAADSTTKLATTAFATTADNLKANLAGPTFTGVVTLPTGTVGITQSAADGSTKLATTAYTDTADALKANLASPTFSGTPTLPTGTIATTQSASDNSTKVSSTAYADAAWLVANCIRSMDQTGYTNVQIYSAVMNNTVGAVTSGTIKMMAVNLPKGFVVNSISWCTGTTGLTTSGTTPHYWVALFDSSRVPLRQSTDNTSTSVSGNTIKTTSLSASFTTTYTGLHYVGVLINCGSTGTMPNYQGITDTASAPAAAAPIQCGTSTVGEGATATNPATAISVQLGKAWIQVQ